jgi:hypothetical protein
VGGALSLLEVVTLGVNRSFIRSVTLGVTGGITLGVTRGITLGATRGITLGITLLVGLALALGCGCRLVSTSIGRIVREPYKYQGSEVTVAGRVEASRWMPAVGAAGFCLVDGRDSLLVLTLKDPPSAGTRVRLQGRFLRRFPMEGTERMVLLYRTDPDDERLTGTVDPR